MVDQNGKITSNVWGSCDGNTLTISDTSMLATAEFYLRKVDKSSPNIFLEGAEFSLNGTTSDGKKIEGKAISDKSGLVHFYGLEAGKYTLKEVKAPVGYVLPDTEWTVEVEHEIAVIHSPNVRDDGSKIKDYPDNLSDRQTKALNGVESMHLKLFYQTEDGYDIIKLYDKNGSPVYMDKNGRSVGEAGKISGGLYGETIRTEEFDFDFNQLTVNFETDGGMGGYGYYGILSYQNVTIKDDNGKELDVSADNSYQIPNALETVTISGMKTWSDNNNQDGKRPESITIRLLKNGQEIDSKEVSESDDWKWSFKDLPKYDGGEEITYTITEDQVEEYSSEINGYNVTNTHSPGKTSIQVTKAWEDRNNQDGKRPDSVTVKLFADGKDTGKELILTKNNNWTGTFAELDEYNNGKKVNYTIEEIKVDGYISSISGNMSKGFVITNIHEPNVKHPSTGDNLGIDAWLNILIFSFMGVVLSIYLKARKHKR